MLSKFLCVLYVCILSLVNSCPENPVPPCTCRTIGYHASIVTCTNVVNEVDLVKSLRSMKSARFPIKTVEIFDAIINFLPSDAFKGLKFSRLHIAGSTMVALSDAEEAFVGLEDCLETLIVQECLLHSGWSWSHLKNLRSLTELHTMHAGLLGIDEEVEEIAHLNITNLFFTKDSISYVHDKAFATFHNIRTLSLKMNEIESLKRSMFPSPALKLEQLILSRNKLRYFPDDLFTKMPSLKYIVLGNNQLFTLDENVFKPVWHQLKKLDVTDNPLNCDCRMNWLLEFSFPLNTWGQCEKPQTQKGTKIKDLAKKDLRC